MVFCAAVELFLHVRSSTGATLKLRLKMTKRKMMIERRDDIASGVGLFSETNERKVAQKICIEFIDFFW